MAGSRLTLRTRASLLTAFLLAASAGQAQEPGSLHLEAGYGHARLTGGFDNWHSTYALLRYRPIPRTTAQLDLLRRSAFGDEGSFVGATLWRDVASSWFITGNAGASAGGFFLPRATAGLGVGRKWLASRQLVTAQSAQWYAQKDAHRDLLLTSTAAYYFAHPAIVQGGVMLNHSSPQSVISASAFLAGEIGDPLRRVLSARVSAGREGYARLADTAIVAFASHTVSLGWRQVVVRDAGVALTAEYYGNRYYRRSQLAAGVFARVR